MKWIAYLVLAAAVAGSWYIFAQKGKEMDVLKASITQQQNLDDPDEMVPKLKSNLSGKEGERTFIGILLTFLCAGLAGIFVVVTLLPFLAQRLTHAVYDSAEEVEKDAMHDARSLQAQGDYEGAIAAFRKAAEADPLNRLPYVEIAKIQKDNLNDPRAAIGTIRHALESQEWQVNDAAYFLFRLAELYNEVEHDRASAVAIMNQVIDEFPETRHSANARNKLHEWEMETSAQEEEQFIARTKSIGGNPPV